MAYLSKYGTLWGAVPHTSGRVFWVGPTSYTVDGRAYQASDNNDGLSPERALASLNQFVTNATADVGDICMVLPGAYTISTTQTISKAGLKIFGIPGGVVDMHERGTRTSKYDARLTGSSVNIFTVSAARVEIAYLHLVPAASKAGIAFAGDDANFHDLTWDMETAAATDTFGISCTGASARPRIANHYVYVADNQGPWFRSASATAGLDGGMIARCRVVLAGTTAWDDAIEITTGVDNFEINDMDFTCSSGALITTCINTTGNTSDHSVTVRRCMHPVSTTLTTCTATSDIVLCNNYIATIRGGTGGTLSTG